MTSSEKQFAKGSPHEGSSHSASARAAEKFDNNRKYESVPVGSNASIRVERGDAIANDLREVKQFQISSDTLKNAEIFLSLSYGPEYAAKAMKEGGFDRADSAMENNRNEAGVSKEAAFQELVASTERKYAEQIRRLEEARARMDAAYQRTYQNFQGLKEQYPHIITEGFLEDLKMKNILTQNKLSNVSIVIAFARERSSVLLNAMDITKTPLALIEVMNSKSEEASKMTKESFKVLEAKVLQMEKISMEVPLIADGKIEEKNVIRAKEIIENSPFSIDQKRPAPERENASPYTEEKYQERGRNNVAAAQETIEELESKLPGGRAQDFPWELLSRYSSVFARAKLYEEVSSRYDSALDRIILEDKMEELYRLISRSFALVAEDAVSTGKWDVVYDTAIQYQKIGDTSNFQKYMKMAKEGLGLPE